MDALTLRSDGEMSHDSQPLILSQHYQSIHKSQTEIESQAQNPQSENQIRNKVTSNLAAESAAQTKKNISPSSFTDPNPNQHQTSQSRSPNLWVPFKHVKQQSQVAAIRSAPYKSAPRCTLSVQQNASYASYAPNVPNTSTSTSTSTIYEEDITVSHQKINL